MCCDAEFLQDLGAAWGRVSRLRSDLGHAMWPIVSEWSWVSRRVERVELHPSGITMRSISFDYALPKSSLIDWRTVFNSISPKFDENWIFSIKNGSKQGLREFGISIENKGEMKRKSLPQYLETPVPLAFLKKGTLVNLNLRNGSGDSIHNLGFYDNGLVMFSALAWKFQELFFGEGSIDQLVFAGISSHEKLEFFVLLTGIFDLIHSTRWGKSEIGLNKSVDDGKRKQAFDGLLKMEVDSSELGSFFESERTPRYSLDHPDYPVNYLYSWLASKIKNRPLKDSVDEHDFVKFLALLATVCDSYLFVAIERYEGMEKEDGSMGTSPRRIIKFQCDAEVRVIENLGMVTKLQSWLLGLTRLPIRYSTWNAKSTHLEIQPVSSTRVKAVGQLLGSGQHISSKPLSFRTSGSRLQITSHTSDADPVTSFEVRLVPNATWGAVCIAFWSFIVNLIVLLVTLMGKGGGFKSFSLEQNLALQAINLAIFFAVVYSQPRHRTAAHCWRSYRWSVVVSFVLSVVGVIYLDFAFPKTDICIDYVSDGKKILCSIAFSVYWPLIFAITSLLVLVMALIQRGYVRNRSLPQAFMENTINRVHGDASVSIDNVMAITETGVFNTKSAYQVRSILLEGD